MFSSSYRQAKPRNEGPLQRTHQIIFRIWNLERKNILLIHYITIYAYYITNIYIYVIYCSGNARGLPAGPRHPMVAPCCTTGPDSYTGFRTSCFCRTSWHIGMDLGETHVVMSHEVLYADACPCPIPLIITPRYMIIVVCKWLLRLWEQVHRSVPFFCPTIFSVYSLVGWYINHRTQKPHALPSLAAPFLWCSPRPSVSCITTSRMCAGKSKCSQWDILAKLSIDGGQANLRLGLAPLVQLFLQLKLFFFLGTHWKLPFRKPPFMLLLIPLRVQPNTCSSSHIP